MKIKEWLERIALWFAMGFGIVMCSVQVAGALWLLLLWFEKQKVIVKSLILIIGILFLIVYLIVNFKKVKDYIKFLLRKHPPVIIELVDNIHNRRLFSR